MAKYNRNETNVHDMENSDIERQDTPATEHLHAHSSPEIVLTAETRYISILGTGAPGTDEFYRKMAYITDVAKDLARKGYAPDSAPVIEILYWYPEDAIAVGIADFYSINPISSLHYRIMAWIHNDIIIEDIEHEARSVGSTTVGDVKGLEIFTLPKQLAVQVMHVGPFANEFGTLERLGALADYYGVKRSGPHHEIHLDPFTRKTPQDRLRTILRDPVA
ncbi:hypothetical protein HF394_06470 [Planococcus glaciei]|uniref:GyrI-like small molecule binding domain-containing protein n=1 Tax=Planococcus glaciei TaxID=459472 RepID=A0A7H8Q9U5_9BACL|nr:hypothetical protein [Planococcus glaciei]QKX50261.1 hypothetical protein HF394_06470 [Planococcus glaciei]